MSFKINKCSLKIKTGSYFYNHLTKIKRFVYKLKIPRAECIPTVNPGKIKKLTPVYSLNLKNGKKYVGMTSNPEKRIGQHFLGNGAKWTQKNKHVSVNHIQKCKSLSNAKKAETIVYKKMRDYHGINKVRGAGHTKIY